MRVQKNRLLTSHKTIMLLLLLKASFIFDHAYGFISSTICTIPSHFGRVIDKLSSCGSGTKQVEGERGRKRRRWITKSLQLSSVTTTTTTISAAAAATSSIESVDVPDQNTECMTTWKTLETKLSSILDENSIQSSAEPVLTFYRDTNGWCPFCERVWVCIKAKNLPYQERLISLFNKPDWYKEMVPTALVPAVLFHEWDKNGTRGHKNSNGTGSTHNEQNSRMLVWESIDIMKALDEAFPDTVKLVHDDMPEYNLAKEQNDYLIKVGFAYLSSGRQNNTTTTDDTTASDNTKQEQEKKRTEFLHALDKLDKALQQSGGPFRLGSNFSGVDAEMIPTLERWRYQLPLKNDPIDILKNRIYLQKWFEAMESYQPYAGRVMGDEYSWTATNAMFVNYFGGTEEEKKKSEEIAKGLIEQFKDVSELDCNVVYALEAAKKIIGNYKAIINDCTNPDPKSQTYIPRSKEEDNSHHLLQFVVEILLSGAMAIKSSSSLPLSSSLKAMNNGQKEDAAIAARAMASRLCVPRDMSAPAAKILRAVLITVADRLTVD